MRAIVIEAPSKIAVKEVAAPTPAPGEALLDVRAAGICGTDLQLQRGYLDFIGIPGHEFVGTVVRVTSPADRVLLGARVAGEISIGCQECAACVEGMARHCATRRVLGLVGKDGAFAQQVTLPVSNLHVVPETLSDDQAVFIEPTAAAFEILDQCLVGPHTDALVLGDGRLGLLAAQALASRGAVVTVLGRHQSKIAAARSLGLKAVGSEEARPGRAYGLVVEATGSPDGLAQALDHVKPRGTVVMKTTCASPTSFDAWKAVVNEVTLVGSRCGRFEPAIEALRTGAVKVDPLISEVLPLDAGLEAFRRAGEKGTLKVLLRVSK